MKRSLLVYDDATLERLLDRDALSSVKKSSDMSEYFSGDISSPPIVFSPNLVEDSDTSKDQESIDNEEMVNDFFRILFLYYQKIE